MSGAVGCFLCCAGVALGLPSFTTATKSASAGGTAEAELFGVAAGCHATFDRLAIRARFATPGYDVRYVPTVLHSGSGLPVALPGTGRLHVVIHPARGHTAGGTPLLPNTLTPLCPNLRRIRRAGDFEGVVSFGLGLKQKTGFRVFRLTTPTRIVIDVAH